NCVVAWASVTGLGNPNAGEIYARRFDATGAPRGGEFRVNTVTTGAQTSPALAVDAAGDFVVAWSSPGDGNGLGVYARRYPAAGVALGAEFLVNPTVTFADQSPTGAAMDAAGNFVIAYRNG